MADKAKRKLIGSLDLFKPSMEAVKLNLWTFFWLAFIPALLSSGSDNTTKMNENSVSSTEAAAFGGVSFILVLIFVAVSIVIAPALIHLQLQSARKKKVGISDALKVGWHFAFRYLGLVLLTVLFVAGGLILFIVPGFIMFRRYFLASYYLIDQGLSIREAMQKSADASKPHSGSIWGIVGVNILLIIPVIVPVFGAIASAILTTLYSVAPALRYEELRKL